MEIIIAKSPQFRKAEVDNLNILLVEDNEYNRLVAYDLLDRWDVVKNIDMAENGKIALEKLQKNSYDVVLMDIQMPIMDGLKATKQIRKLNQPICNIPVIALTADVFKEEIQECIRAGMNDYITKPIDPALFFDKILNIVMHKDSVSIKEEDLETMLSESDEDDEIRKEASEPKTKTQEKQQPAIDEIGNTNGSRKNEKVKIVDLSFMKNMYQGKNRQTCNND